MTRNEIALQVFNSPLIKKEVKFHGGKNADELMQLLMLKVLETSDSKLSELVEANKVIEWFWVVMRNMAVNPRSEFNKIVSSCGDSFDNDFNITDETAVPNYLDYPEFPDFIEFCKKKQQSENNYIRLCADTIVTYFTLTDWRNNTFKQFSKDTGINHTSISVYFNEMKRQFKSSYESRVDFKQ